MTGDPARYDVPNVRGVVGWVLFTWLTAVVGVVLSVTAGNWVAAGYAVNSAVCAAGWWQAASRWAEWRATAEAYISEKDKGAG